MRNFVNHFSGLRKSSQGLFFAGIAGLFLADTCLLAAPTSKEMLAEVTQFMKKNVMGKKLYINSVSKIANGTVEAHFTRQCTFANLVVEENGFYYDEQVEIKQTNYPLNENGTKGAGEVRDRSITARYYYQALQSVPALIGYSQLISTTMPEWKNGSESFNAQFKDGVLEVSRNTPLASDCFAKEGFYPCQVDGLERLAFKDGKLSRETTSTAYEVAFDLTTRAFSRLKIASGPKTQVETETKP